MSTLDQPVGSKNGRIEIDLHRLNGFASKLRTQKTDLPARTMFHQLYKLQALVLIALLTIPLAGVSDAGVIVGKPDISFSGVSTVSSTPGPGNTLDVTLSGGASAIVNAQGERYRLHYGAGDPAVTNLFAQLLTPATFELDAILTFDGDNRLVSAVGGFTITGGVGNIWQNGVAYSYPTSPVPTRVPLLAGTLQEVESADVVGGKVSVTFLASLDHSVDNGGHFADSFGEKLVLTMSIDAGANMLTSFNAASGGAGDVAAQAVPEPASGSVWAFLVLGAAVLRRRSRNSN